LCDFVFWIKLKTEVWFKTRLYIGFHTKDKMTLEFGYKINLKSIVLEFKIEFEDRTAH